MKRKKPPKEFTFRWLFEAFDRDETFAEKRTFGCLAAYVYGRMVMALTEDPGERSYRGKDYGYDIWYGIMFPTEKAYHASLMKEFPALRPHPVLGKWLYLEAANENFETIAEELAKKIARNDLRFGVEPQMRFGRKSASPKKQKPRNP